MLRTYRRADKRTSRFDVSSMCRMCLTQNFSDDKLVRIFVEEPVTNVSVIKFCTGLECEEDDGLPPKMCYNCYNSLITFFAFKKMCLASDKYCKAFMDAQPANNEAPVIIEDVEPKEEPWDELSLAENNDMGLLETDCIHPGAPDDVLIQIKKCEEEYQLAHPNENVDCNTRSVVPTSNGNEEVEEEVEEEEEEFLPHFQHPRLRKQEGQTESVAASEPLETVRHGPVIVSDCSVVESRPVRPPSPETPLPRHSLKPPQKTVDHILQTKPVKQSQSLDEILAAASESPFFIRMDEKKYSCDLCSKQFLSPNSLKRHIKNHGSAQYKCPQCCKDFHQRSSMKRHLLLHSDRRFICSSCSKVLLSREGLKCHIRTHHTARTGRDYYKYKCTHCSKTFAHSSGLSRHMAIHRGISYECEICLKKFNDSSQLKRHKLKNHPSIDSHAFSALKDVQNTGSIQPTSVEPTPTTVA